MRKVWLFLFGWLLLAAPVAVRADFSFQALDDPNASAASGGTMAQGVSGTNIVGTYFDGSSQAHGFLYDGNSYTTLDEPNSIVTNSPGNFTYFGTWAIGVSGGEIVGYYMDSSAQLHGFTLSSGAYTTLDEPNAVFNTGPGSYVYFGTEATGVSGSNIVGDYVDINGLNHGFLYDGSTYTTLDEPNVGASSFDGTYADGVDGGNIVGYFQNPSTHGFLFDGSAYTTLDEPDAVGFTEAGGISSTNIVGYYSDANAHSHGFLYNGGVYTSFDYPSASQTYATGISSNTIVGYYADSNSITHGFIATVTPAGAPTGSLQVAIMPPTVVTAGAQWRVDGGAFQTNEATVTNLSITNHTVSFSTVSGWNAPSNQTVAVTTNATATVTGTYVQQALLLAGSLQITLGPAGAVSAGAQWSVDGGAFQTNEAIVTNLSVGSHTVSFNTIFGWNAPSDQVVMITNGVTTAVTSLFTAWVVPTDGLILITNGSGTIQQGKWPQVLVVGNQYTVKALPKPGNLFEKWVGGTSFPYIAFSTSASYTFTMQSDLVLQADFVTNPFLAAHGTYQGLFAPATGNRTQTNSGSFNLTLTTGGAASGKLNLGGQTVPMTGKFGADGSAQITSKRHNASSLTTALQLNVTNQAVTGTVSNDDGSFVAQLTGYQNVFSSHNKATNYAGRYTLTIPGTTNPAAGPSGPGYGTVLVGPSGTLAFAGSLADGTPVSQSSVLSAGGYWPLYMTLYGGKGSLWSWNYFTNGAITNAIFASPSYASWINPTNASKTAIYRSGFTNQTATVTGGLYLPADQALLVLTSGTLILEGGDLPSTITNQLTSASADNVVFTGPTNMVTLAINQTNGVISGSFSDPSDSSAIIKLNGVLAPGRENTNATGYFLGPNHAGTFILIPE